MQNKKKNLNKRLYIYALSIVQFTEKLSVHSIHSSILARQLLRSGTSVAANVMEAKAASSKKDYINFYTYALKSANESIFWLYVIRDSGKARRIKCDDQIQKIIIETEELANILGASIITMKNNSKKE